MPTHNFPGGYQKDPQVRTNIAVIPGTMKVTPTDGAPPYAKGKSSSDANRDISDANLNIRGGAPMSAVPVNTRAAAITGTTAVGGTLTCTPGNWVGFPDATVTRQWRRNGTDVAGQTGLTFSTTGSTAGQTITCMETANNGVGGNVTQVSNGIVLT